MSSHLACHDFDAKVFQYQHNAMTKKTSGKAQNQQKNYWRVPVACWPSCQEKARTKHAAIHSRGSKHVFRQQVAGSRLFLLVAYGALFLATKAPCKPKQLQAKIPLQDYVFAQANGQGKNKNRRNLPDESSFGHKSCGREAFSRPARTSFRTMEQISTANSWTEQWYVGEFRKCRCKRDATWRKSSKGEKLWRFLTGTAESNTEERGDLGEDDGMMGIDGIPLQSLCSTKHRKPETKPTASHIFEKTKGSTDLDSLFADLKPQDPSMCRANPSAPA